MYSNIFVFDKISGIILPSTKAYILIVDKAPLTKKTPTFFMKENIKTNIYGLLLTRITQ